MRTARMEDTQQEGEIEQGTAAGRGCRRRASSLSDGSEGDQRLRIPRDAAGACKYPERRAHLDQFPSVSTPIRSSTCRQPISCPIKDRRRSLAAPCAPVGFTPGGFCTTTSRALVGSSAIINWGSSAVHPAMHRARCFVPPALGSIEGDTGGRHAPVARLPFEHGNPPDFGLLAHETPMSLGSDGIFNLVADAHGGLGEIHRANPARFFIQRTSDAVPRCSSPGYCCHPE